MTADPNRDPATDAKPAPAPGPAAAPAPLRFEHLVQINDPHDPRVTPLTREQLWRGLVLRAEFPGTFVPWLDACEIERESEHVLVRTQTFGAQLVRERVRFAPQDSVDYEVLGGEARYHLSMRIETRGPEQLYLRFVYEAESPDHREGGPLSGAIKEAYRFADIDTVFRIRQLAASGVLDD
jgi:hypothetical protein